MFSIRRSCIQYAIVRCVRYLCVTGRERETKLVRHDVTREYQYEVVKSLAGASSVGEGKACRLVLPGVPGSPALYR